MLASLVDDSGDRRPRVVHRLMLLAFVGPCPPGYEARHLDANRSNNTLSNVVWGTKEENAADRIRHGNQARGEKINTSRLSPDQVREIRHLYAETGIGYRRLSARYGVHRNAIQMIVWRKSWAHID